MLLISCIPSVPPAHWGQPQATNTAALCSQHTPGVKGYLHCHLVLSTAPWRTASLHFTCGKRPGEGRCGPCSKALGRLVLPQVVQAPGTDPELSTPQPQLPPQEEEKLGSCRRGPSFPSCHPSAHLAMLLSPAPVLSLCREGTPLPLLPHGHPQANVTRAVRPSGYHNDYLPIETL
jgi:hypothetical protein